MIWHVKQTATNVSGFYLILEQNCAVPVTALLCCGITR